MNYVTDGNGNVSVEFNDNSKFFCGKDGNKLEPQPPGSDSPILTEADLQEMAKNFGFKLEMKGERRFTFSR